MQKILFYCFSLLILNSCNSQSYQKYIEHFYNNESNFNNVVEYLNNNYYSLYESSCADSMGLLLINKMKVEKTGCYAEQKDTLKKILYINFFDMVELRDTTRFEFVLDFLPNDEKDLETTIYLVYLEKGRNLPNYYQNWVGYKKRLNEDWWLLEYKNAQF